MDESTYEVVKELVGRVARENGVELVDIQFPRFKARQLVRIFIDKEGGVTLDDCRHVSLKVGDALDIEDPFPTRYTLEVSSPGVDRPLKTPGDFRRNIGRTLRIAVTDSADQEKTYTGILRGVLEETAVLETAEGEKAVPLGSVRKAQVCTAF